MQNLETPNKSTNNQNTINTTNQSLLEQVKYNNYQNHLVDGNKSKLKTFLIILTSIIILFIISFFLYTLVYTEIFPGISIHNFDVSNKSKSDARYQIDNYIESSLPSEITLVYNDFSTNISLEQLEIDFNTKEAAERAFSVGRESSALLNPFIVMNTLIQNKNISTNLEFDTEVLTAQLSNISTQLPDAVEQSSYFIEDSNLIITSGKPGSTIDIEATINDIKNSIYSFDCLNNPINITTTTIDPLPIDIEQIHSEIYKTPVDAYFTQDPFAVYPSQNGVDFNISLEEANAIISENIQAEYSIPLKTLIPNITTNMIGTEAFPDLISSFTTKYNQYDTNRSTNVILSSNKINTTVLMPGEIFSYNQVVGQRTIAAGYKEAPMYVSGEVVDGLGGGICQTTSTLYNAVLYANLEIVERSNHQFIPSYSSASRDATVVYGALDFKFKNNRDYPIKIISTASNGSLTIDIYGLNQSNDFDITISSYQTGSSSTHIYSEAYLILSQDGKEFERRLLSKDIYKKY